MRSPDSRDRRPPGQMDIFVWPATIYVWAQALTGLMAMFAGYDSGLALVMDNVMLLIALGLSLVVALGRRRGEFDKPTGLSRVLNAVIVIGWSIAALLLAFTGTFGFVDNRPGPVGGAIALVGGLSLAALGGRTLIRVLRERDLGY